MYQRVGSVAFAVLLGVLASSPSSAGPICVDPSSCGGPVGCASDADCLVPGEACIVGFDPMPPHATYNICCAACPGSPTPFASCASTFADCDGCSLGCVEPVDAAASMAVLPQWGVLLLAVLLTLAMGAATRRMSLVPSVPIRDREVP